MADLQFLSLHIENFKSFSGSHDFELDRQPGLYYVTGQNILAPELGANGVGKSTLIADGAFWCLWGKTSRDNRPANAIQPWGKKGKTEAALQWMRGGERHVICRTRSPNHLIHSIVEGSLWISEREITQEDVPGLIGMSEEMFRRTLILGQFGQLFLDLKPEAQSQMFTEALSLNIWLKAAQLASDAEKQASREQAAAESNLMVCKALLDNLSSQIETSADEARRFEIDRAARIAKIEKGIATLEADLKGLKEVKEPALPADEEMTRLMKVLSAKKVDLALLSGELADAERVEKSTAAALQLLEKQLKDKQKLCPACGQPISNKDFNEKLAAAKADHGDAQKRLTEKTEQRRLGIDKRADAEKAVADQEAKSQQAKEAYREKLAAYTNYCATLRATRAELQRQKTQLEQEQNAVNVFQQSVDVNKTKRQAKRAEKSALEAELESFGAKIEEAKFWADAYREIRLSVIDEALIELEMASSRHAAMLGLNDWGIRFDTARETKAGQVSYGFTVLLYPPGEDQPVKWESYSGGESQRWQLAVSFALSEVLLSRAGLSPNIEVLDEPTRGLSADGVDNLLEHLRDRALELGRAIYFIDHHSLDKGAFDGTLLITKNKKGSSAQWL